MLNTMSKKVLQAEIIDHAEKLFIRKGFQNFHILELSALTNIDSKIINDFFITKGGLLLSILSELYVEFFALNCSFYKHKLTTDAKKKIFNQINFLHKRKIDLFISLFDRKELSHLDTYLLKLFCKTISLHFKIFLMQLHSNDYNFLKSGKSKYFYFLFFEKYKHKVLEKR